MNDAEHEMRSIASNLYRLAIRTRNRGLFPLAEKMDLLADRALNAATLTAVEIERLRGLSDTGFTADGVIEDWED